MIAATFWTNNLLVGAATNQVTILPTFEHWCTAKLNGSTSIRQLKATTYFGSLLLLKQMRTPSLGPHPPDSILRFILLTLNISYLHDEVLQISSSEISKSMSLIIP